ncbi:MAG: hypothetical protein AAFY78_02740 [Cyanobacteria bacterium J06648_16]
MNFSSEVLLMSYMSSSTRVSGADRAIASLLAAGIMFVAGYTAVRMTLGQSVASGQDADVTYPVVPHEATLWADGFSEL